VPAGARNNPTIYGIVGCRKTVTGNTHIIFSRGTKAMNTLPIKAKPFKHQIEAYRFVLSLFGIAEGGDVEHISIRSRGAALLMEM
jgi:hypothetical protein